MSHAQAHTLKGAFVPRSTFYESPFGRMFGKLLRTKDQSVTLDSNKMFGVQECFKPQSMPKLKNREAVRLH